MTFDFLSDAGQFGFADGRMTELVKSTLGTLPPCRMRIQVFGGTQACLLVSSHCSVGGGGTCVYGGS